MANEDTVLVTGGSGYIGGWCVARLLNDGFRVRATVRNLAREQEVRRALKAIAADAAGEKLAFFAADLLRDEGWAAAVQGCRYVLHVASPIEVAARRDPQRLIEAARAGALRVLKAAVAVGVERIVMTSSSTAVATGLGAGRFNETNWTEPEAKGVDAYARSKTLAERAAWDFIGRTGGNSSLATVLPALAIGPVMSGDFSPSILLISRLLKGQVPGIPNLGLEYVDARDVADLHLRAMLAPAAAGERFIASSEFLWLPEVAAILRQNLGAAAARIPTRRLADWLVRLVALFDREVAEITQFLSLRIELDASKARRALGWKPRPARDSIVDCAQSLIDLKLV